MKTSANTNTAKFSLAALTFASVTPTQRGGKPNAAVRQNGQIVFSKAANDIIGYPKNQFFKIGADDEGKVYLIPAKGEEANVLKGTKNNDSFQFRQADVLKGLGMLPKNRYTVSEGKEGEGDAAVTYYVLTPMTKEEAEAHDAAEKVELVNSTVEDIAKAAKNGKKSK